MSRQGGHGLHAEDEQQEMEGIEVSRRQEQEARHQQSLGGEVLAAPPLDSCGPIDDGVQEGDEEAQDHGCRAACRVVNADQADATHGRNGGVGGAVEPGQVGASRLAWWCT